MRADTMTQDSTQNTRRQYLQYAGSAIVGTTLAGCSGGDGGDGDSGDGGSGDGGNSGATTDEKEREKVRMVLSPFGFAGIIYDQMLNETDRLSTRMDEAGYEVEAKESWEGSALFAAGGPDFTDMGAIEAATLATERDLDLAVNGRMASYFTGWLVKNGGPYDTETTGGVEASVKKIADEGKFAIGSWGGGDVQAYHVLMNERYGLRFAENDSDFEVVTADYFALPGLVTDGKVAATSTAPHYGAASMFASDPPKLESLFYTSDMLTEMGYGPSMINSWTCTQEFAEGNPEAVQALVGAWQETVKDFYSRPYELATEGKYMEMLAVENETQAEWLIDWGVKNEYDYGTPVLYRDTKLTDDRISKEKKFIDASAELGFVAKDWNDRLEFRTVSP